MKTSSILLILCCVQFLFAQSPYELSLKLDLPLVLGGTALTLGGAYMQEQTVPLTEAEINALDPMDVNAFDRSATRNLSGAASARSDIGMYGGGFMALGSTLLFPAFHAKTGKNFFKEFGTLAFLWYETNSIVTGLTLTTKALSQRPRPFVFNPNERLSRKQSQNARHSFFSGHTSFAAVNSFLFAKFYVDYFPESKWKPVIWTVSAIIPAWTGIERYNSGNHYFTDVIVGYAVGALGGYFVPHFHKRKDKKSSFMIYPANFNDGYGLGMNLRF